MTIGGEFATKHPGFGSGAAERAGRQHDGRAIVHPAVDFLCLGGASLLLLPLLIALPETSRPVLILVMWAIAEVINHPHFAASYQIFYRGFRQKAFGAVLNRSMRIRYIVAGLAVPAALVSFLGVALALGDAKVLGWGANLMLFLVGWHYTKQGYGMLIVDSVYQRRFFSEGEKAVFRYNAYACWLLFWLCANQYVAERELWGLAYYGFAVPPAVLFIVGATALATTALTLWVFARRLTGNRGGLPLAGTVAYVATLYVWLAARFEPTALLFVPAFHSLQYLLIVWRFEANRSIALTGGTDIRAARWSMARFAAAAVLLGFAGFWWAPMLLDAFVTYDRAALGGTAFLFFFWIVINVHHYFIDNVLWRRENPETGRYLFGPTPVRN
jgi:hypothetical protein